jgi:hypothetical protein
MIKQAFMTQDENGNWVKKKTKKEKEMEEMREN